MGKKKKVTIGYWYLFGIHMGISRGPVDEMVEIKVGDRSAWQGSVTQSGSIYINAPDLFGGEKKEGGVQGTFDVMMGEPTQVAAPRLVNMLGGPLPGYRRMFTGFFDGRIAAMNPYPKKWGFRVRRALMGWENDTPWYPEKAVIWLADNSIRAMNAAHIVYECLTNKEWGRGIPPVFIDEAAFRNVADTLFDEKFGLCLKWARRDDIRTFIQSVIDHVGASVFTDRGTGLITMKLIRGDYIADTLPVYTTENGLIEITENTVAASPSTINQIIVDYVDPVTNETRQVRSHSIAAIQANEGGINSMTKKYSGIPTGQLALRVAQRDLRALSFPLRRFRLVFDRRAWRINPGDVFRIKNPARGLADIVLRAGRVEDGTLTNGRITITAVQDIFSFPLSSFTGVEPPRWQPPATQAELKRHRIIEIPYTTLARYTNTADFNVIGFDAGYLGTLVEKPTPLSTNYDVAVRSGPPDPEDWPED